MGGFFTKHGKFSTGGGDFSVAPDGIYVCKLKEIESLEQPSFDDQAIMEPKYKWVFEGANDDATDDDGKPFRFVKFTKRDYGHEKAGMTILLDSMLGRHLTQDEFEEFDLPDLTARKFRVCVEETNNAKGNAINKILWVKPEQAKKKATGEAADAHIEKVVNGDSNAPFSRPASKPAGAGPKVKDPSDPFDDEE